MFIAACKTTDQWNFIVKKGQIPKCRQTLIDKYHHELFLGKDSFLLQSEKQKICPLYPLTSFPDNHKAHIDDKDKPKDSLLL